MLLALSTYAQGPYAPAVGTLGSKAMHKDSSSFVAWASGVSIERGKRNIAIASSDTTNVGVWSDALHIADGSVVSLGDKGTASLSFDGLIYNGIGPDFAIFENAFNHTFLELAFVEVSSDGVNFFRFPSHSLTDTSIAIGSFGAIDPTNINNLAGKYRASYGTPFDLEELRNEIGLDIQNISHIRIIDVVGSLVDPYATRDSQGRKINDQYPTAFPSGGFDLDGVGVVYLKTVGLSEEKLESIQVYPNPVIDDLHFPKKWEGASLKIYNTNGALVKISSVNESRTNLSTLKSGLYNLSIQKGNQYATTKFIKH